MCRKWGPFSISLQYCQQYQYCQGGPTGPAAEAAGPSPAPKTGPRLTPQPGQATAFPSQEQDNNGIQPPRPLPLNGKREQSNRSRQGHPPAGRSPPERIRATASWAIIPSRTPDTPTLPARGAGRPPRTRPHRLARWRGETIPDPLKPSRQGGAEDALPGGLTAKHLRNLLPWNPGILEQPSKHKPATQPATQPATHDRQHMTGNPTRNTNPDHHRNDQPTS